MVGSIYVLKPCTAAPCFRSLCGSTALGVFERAVRESLLEAATEIACALKLCYDMRLALHCDNAGADHLDGELNAPGI